MRQAALIVPAHDEALTLPGVLQSFMAVGRELERLVCEGIAAVNHVHQHNPSVEAAASQPDFRVLGPGGRTTVIEVKQVVEIERAFPIVPVKVLRRISLAERAETAYLDVELYLLVWAIATRVLIARWDPQAAGGFITALDIVIGILITRVIPPETIPASNRPRPPDRSLACPLGGFPGGFGID